MELGEATGMLARTPAVLSALLAGLPEDWVHRDDGPDTWSAYDIVGHLVEGEAGNWLARTRLILDEGTGATFRPFDREAMLRKEREPVGVLLARFAAARRASLDELAALGVGPEHLSARGRHPGFGEVTLAQLLSTWVAHDLTHLGQIGEVLAGRYRDDVGPYRAYLPALDRTAAAE